MLVTRLIIVTFELYVNTTGIDKLVVYNSHAFIVLWRLCAPIESRHLAAVDCDFEHGIIDMVLVNVSMCC